MLIETCYDCPYYVEKECFCGKLKSWMLQITVNRQIPDYCPLRNSKKVPGMKVLNITKRILENGR